MTPLISMLAPGLMEAGSRLIDRLIPDTAQRDQAKLALLEVEGQQALQEMQVSLSAILAEANSAYPWMSRARPTFLYVIYSIILHSVVCDRNHHRHLVATANFSGGRESEQVTGCNPGKPLVAVQCRLPWLHRRTQLRQVARCRSIACI